MVAVARRKSILCILIATYDKQTLSFRILYAYLNIPKTDKPEKSELRKTDEFIKV